MITLASPPWKLVVKNLHGLNETMDDWRTRDKTNRLWCGDATLWTGADEPDWLGWLTIVEEQLEQFATLEQLTFGISVRGSSNCWPNQPERMAKV